MEIICLIIYEIKIEKILFIFENLIHKFIVIILILILAVIGVLKIYFI